MMLVTCQAVRRWVMTQPATSCWGYFPPWPDLVATYLAAETHEPWRVTGHLAFNGTTTRMLTPFLRRALFYAQGPHGEITPAMFLRASAARPQLLR